MGRSQPRTTPSTAAGHADPLARLHALLAAEDMEQAAALLAAQPKLAAEDGEALRTVVRSRSERTNELVALLLSYNAPFPRYLLKDACRSGVEPAVFDRLLRYEPQHVPPQERFGVATAKEFDGAGPALLAMDAQPTVSVRLVSYLLDWHEKTQSDVSEMQRDFQRLELLRMAGIVAAQSQELLLDLLALPKLRAALQAAESVAFSCDRACQPPETTRYVCEVRHVVSRAMLCNWPQALQTMESVAPTAVREAVFSTLPDLVGGECNVAHEMAQRHLRDLRWASTKPLILVRYRHRQQSTKCVDGAVSRQRCVLAELPEAIFREVVAYCRADTNERRLLRQCRTANGCMCKGADVPYCSCHRPVVRPMSDSDSSSEREDDDLVWGW